jgi:hypothetical protein
MRASRPTTAFPPTPASPLRPSAARLRALLLAPILAALGACQSGGGGGPGQVSEGFHAPDRELLHEAVVSVLREQGFVVDPLASSVEGGVVQTRWNLSLQPFSRMGYRERAIVRVQEVPSRPGWFRVESNVTREVNSNMTEPSNPIVARWEGSQRVPAMENMITKRVEMQFIAPRVSPEFRAKHGMPRARDPSLDAPPPAPDRIGPSWLHPPASPPLWERPR